MPAMPREKKAKKISDRIMKNTGSNDKEIPNGSKKADREPRFDYDVRTMIKR